MKRHLLFICLLLVIFFAGCAHNLPVMKLKYNVAPYEKKLQNKGNLIISYVRDQRPSEENTPTKYKDTVILSGQTEPPTVDYFKQAITDEINESGLFTVVDQATPNDVLIMKNGSVIKGKLEETTMDSVTVKSVKLSNDLGTMQYEGSEIESITKSEADIYTLSVNLKSAKVLKEYSAINYIFILPAYVVNITYPFVMSPALVILAMGLLLIDVAIVPDSYQTTQLLNVDLKKGDTTVFSDEFAYRNKKLYTQFGNENVKVKRGAVLFDKGTGAAIRDMITKMKDKI